MIKLKVNFNFIFQHKMIDIFLMKRLRQTEQIYKNIKNSKLNNGVHGQLKWLGIYKLKLMKYRIMGWIKELFSKNTCKGKETETETEREIRP